MMRGTLQWTSIPSTAADYQGGSRNILTVVASCHKKWDRLEQGGGPLDLLQIGQDISLKITTMNVFSIQFDTCNCLLANVIWYNIIVSATGVGRKVGYAGANSNPSNRRGISNSSTETKNKVVFCAMHSLPFHSRFGEPSQSLCLLTHQGLFYFPVSIAQVTRGISINLLFGWDANSSQCYSWWT